MQMTTQDGGYDLGRPDSQQHRNSHEIIKQMLQIVDSKGGGNGSKTLEIAYTCELTWNQFKSYRDLLLKQDLLHISSDDNNASQRYEISDSGKRYLQLFAEIEDDLKPLVSQSVSMYMCVLLKLITALCTAVENGEGSLDKEATSHDDLFDAFRMSLMHWRRRGRR